MKPLVLPMSCPGRVWVDDARMGNAPLFGLFGQPVELVKAEGRFTHCCVYFAWDSHLDPDEGNWDGVRLSLWAKSGPMFVRLSDFVVGAAGMEPVNDAAGSLYSRSGLVLQASDVLCDAFVVCGENPSAAQRFGTGQFSLEVWSVT